MLLKSKTKDFKILKVKKLQKRNLFKKHIRNYLSHLQHCIPSGLHILNFICQSTLN